MEHVDYDPRASEREMQRIVLNSATDAALAANEAQYKAISFKVACVFAALAALSAMAATALALAIGGC